MLWTKSVANGNHRSWTTRTMTAAIVITLAATLTLPTAANAEYNYSGGQSGGNGGGFSTGTAVGIGVGAAILGGLLTSPGRVQSGYNPAQSACDTSHGWRGQERYQVVANYHTTRPDEAAHLAKRIADLLKEAKSAREFAETQRDRASQWTDLADGPNAAVPAQYGNMARLATGDALAAEKVAKAKEAEAAWLKKQEEASRHLTSAYRVEITYVERPLPDGSCEAIYTEKCFPVGHSAGGGRNFNVSGQEYFRPCLSATPVERVVYRSVNANLARLRQRAAQAQANSVGEGIANAQLNGIMGS